MTFRFNSAFKEWKIYLRLLICSLFCYSVFLSHQFIHLNSLLSSITLDSIKNYYTFVYHAAADKTALHFEGMNYPLGEHVVYTDCQPLISTLLQYLPIPADYLIGVLHFLLYFSFIIAPLFIYAVFRRFSLSVTASFLSALAIALLSPQFLKINAGHHALAYGCLIPWCLLLVLKQQQEPSFSTTTKLGLFNLLIFFIHPYLGFCFSVLTFIAVGIFLFKDRSSFKKTRLYLPLFFTAVFPVLFFKVFMKLSDTHINRPEEPYGLEVMVENAGSLLSPEFGPFKEFLSAIFPERSQHFEGHSYVGFFVILLSLVLLISLPLYIKKLKLPAGLGSLFIASLVLLAISFGYHHKLLQAMGINSPSVNQFRAVCRFAWVFYFVLPITVVIFLQQFLSLTVSSQRKNKNIFLLILSLFLLSNLSEAGSLIGFNADAYWKFRNFFNSKLLSPEEEAVLARLEADSTQAILSLPLFHGGSELYDRNGSSNSMAPAMLYSYHSRLPIIGIMASRGSRTETEDCISLLNSYKSHQPLAAKFNAKNILVILTRDALLPDEERLKQSLTYFQRSDSLNFALLSPADLFKPKIQEDSEIIRGSGFDSSVIYIKHENHPPFTSTTINDFKTITILDSNQVADGRYILSFHYHYQPKSYRDIALDLIVTESLHGQYAWRDLLPVRCVSGFYKGYAVFETFVQINPHARYEFILSGKENRSYHISDFLLRPADKDVKIVTAPGDTLFNNFAR